MVTKQRGRPKLDDHTIQLKRETIVQSAKHLFKVEGVDAVSMRKIASHAGMGTMTLYKYFPTKREILHHIWLEFFDALLTEVGSCPDKLDDFEKLKWKSSKYLEYWIGHSDQFRMVFLNEDRADEQDDFFVQHAGMEDKFNELFLDHLVNISSSKSESEVKALSHELICFLNGIALNLITISEFSWVPYESMLDGYLSRLIK